MTTAKPGKRPPRVRYFRARNRLRAKVGASGAPGKEPGKISAEALERAMAEIKKAEEDYPDWLRETLSELDQELSSAREMDPADRGKHMRKFENVAHELKGQGGTFGYPLISRFGKSLNEFAGHAGERITDNHLEIVKAHVDVMRAVINDRLAGAVATSARN